jgi:serine/threonine protein kinase, bacterial
MPMTEGDVFAGFKILRLLGAGGMGEVYLVEHPRLPRYDALKILPAGLSANREFRERFNREADLVATLFHPHIIAVHDRGEFDGQLWISMDYLDGPDSGRLMRELYPPGLPRAMVIRLVTAVAEALDYAHGQGLLHRDVKPANILLTNPASGVQRILLADFGIARSVYEPNSITQANTIMGTVTYAAPELLTGQHLDGRVDQYALAATAYELLAGAPLFDEPNPAVVIARHLNELPPALALRRPELADLDPALSRALSKNPADRFVRCADFARALAGVPMSHPGVAVDPTPTMPAPVRSTRPIPIPAVPAPPVPAADVDSRGRGTAAMGEPGRRRRWLAPAVAVGAILLLIGVAFALRPWKDNGRTGTQQLPPTSEGLSLSPTSSPTTTSSGVVSAITFENMRDVVVDLYGALPAHPLIAWEKFDQHYRNRTGFDDFLAFWSTIQTVTVVSVKPRDATSVVARLVYLTRAEATDTEDRWLSMVLSDGKLLVFDSERTGSP